ncbi:phosphatidylglycerophosphatase [Wolbachia endosymbiont of Cruorifilaria tuberocauda]|uniref:phosphatidylglycerophosphatase n=1 Tax=Wolbachia endosymbiont of Cruorifilaria tuberocauda TaxID=1812111 RepID=UPI00158A88BE|nr:phosphatidylglycerophosphatase [Wolbachia endosymbiont of Cruorifilaria tuberocauda]QKX01944.1 phosphatidylglycerophosphatase [Wolbachia endosymbiont of Cruorifilaria tuberocauda]
MKVFWTVLKKILSILFPAKVVSSFLGIGYLPSWQNYWSSFLILLIVDITLIFIYGIDFILYKVPYSFIIIAAIFVKLAVSMLVLQLIGISIFHIQDPSANSGENIVIQIASGQVLTVALSMPAIMSIYSAISRLYGSICKEIIQCSSWFNNFMHLLFFFMIPYAFFNIIEMVKPWPISSIQLSYNNAISITFEGIFHTFYAVVLLYLAAFILCDLTMHDAIILSKSIIQYAKESSSILSSCLLDAKK